MYDLAILETDVQSLDQLSAKLPDILAAAPKDQGTLDMIISRPDHGERNLPHSVEVTAAGGVAGDHWKRPDANVDMQICMMMSGCIGAIAGDKANWPAAGDNFFLDMDLTPGNMPPGTRFAIGSAEFLVTSEPHNGCQGFIDRYGRDACLFVNTGKGKELRLRGIYAKVTKDGTVTVGDAVRKL